MSVLHNIYTRLGGKDGSYLQRKWSSLFKYLYSKPTISSYLKKRARKKQISNMHKYAMKTLLLFKSTCEECKVEGWLEYGTLLGAYRDKSFIPFDFDLDVGMYDVSYTEVFEKALFKKGFKKVREFFLVSTDNPQKRIRTEVCLSYKGLTMDIFFSFEEQDARRSYLYIEPFDVKRGERKFRAKYYTLPKASPCEKVVINNNEFNAPCKTEQILSIWYGKSFMKPDPNWKPDPFNPFVKFLDTNNYYGLDPLFLC